MSLIIQSIQVSFLAMAVIFLVLGILIGVINALVKLLPYTAPAPHVPKAKTSAVQSPSSSQDEDHIAAIHAVLAHHLGKAPQDIHIANITSL